MIRALAATIAGSSYRQREPAVRTSLVLVILFLIWTPVALLGATIVAAVTEFEIPGVSPGALAAATAVSVLVAYLASRLLPRDLHADAQRHRRS